MAVSIEKVKELLGNGLSNEVVASTIGVHPSFISQLMSDEKFYSEVVDKRTKTLASHTVRDRSLDSIEDKLIKKLDENIDAGLVYKTTDLLRCFSVINSAKRRGVSVPESTVINNNVVNLTIPAPIAAKFIANQTGEIVEAQGRALVTMPARSLLNQLVEKHKQSKEDKAAVYSKVGKYLPTTTGDLVDVPDKVKNSGGKILRNDGGLFPSR